MYIYIHIYTYIYICVCVSFLLVICQLMNFICFHCMPFVCILSCGINQGLIPLAIHCDGAEFYSNSEYMVWSIGSCLVENDHVFDTKFVTCCLPHEAMQSNDVFWSVNMHYFREGCVVYTCFLMCKCFP